VAGHHAGKIESEGCSAIDGNDIAVMGVDPYQVSLIDLYH
jgi:hypothetical protein